MAALIAWMLVCSCWWSCQGRRHQRGHARLRRAMAPPPPAVFDPW